ncbi:MAG: helix-hairpin-helix domain-containing protein [bacterium]|nr:helix-hairpin-helix domain-containing protein [bacterium]MCM1375385.1 helix-hairpin-helix domain-containing protein [Muribaculum sp.]
MTNRKSNTLILVGFMLLPLLSGCGRDREILYFGGEASVGSGVQVTEEPESVRDSGEASQAVSGQIYVHVCGQVRQPGVVKLPDGSRAWEAVEAAGGLTEEAQEAAVNLAAALRDGEKLYIPCVGEYVEEAANSGLINLNTADVDRLQTLSGIGESRAADIVSYRERHGAFRTIEEIMQVPGIKESIYEKIRDQITVD